jgi:hypothetical protein
VQFVEYAVVGLLVLAAAAYAAWRLWRALRGKCASGCPFLAEGLSRCETCAENSDAQQKDSPGGNGSASTED